MAGELAPLCTLQWHTTGMVTVLEASCGKPFTRFIVNHLTLSV